MLQTVAVMGPARINAPLTQAITAPMMGRLQARGARPLTEFLACLGLRLVHYTVLLAAFIFVILGGLDEFTGSYETLTGWLGIVPQGPAAALAVTAAGQLLWAIFFSTIQVAAYRRALGNWPPADDADPGAPPRTVEPSDTVERGSGRFDPRAIVRRRPARDRAPAREHLLAAAARRDGVADRRLAAVPARLRRGPARPRPRRPARRSPR